MEQAQASKIKLRTFFKSWQSRVIVVATIGWWVARITTPGMSVQLIAAYLAGLIAFLHMEFESSISTNSQSTPTYDSSVEAWARVITCVLWPLVASGIIIFTPYLILLHNLAVSKQQSGTTT